MWQFLVHVQHEMPIRQFIQMRKHVNVLYVAKSSVPGVTLQFIRELILERNHINVMYVARPLIKLQDKT